MTAVEFNEKYVDWLVDGFPGLEIDDEFVVDYLDKKFETLILYSNFRFYKIKERDDNDVRVYCLGISPDESVDMEIDIEGILQANKVLN